MARVNKTRYAILGLLSHQPMSGYDIKKMIEKYNSFFWSESNGQLYPILNQLITEKMVTCELDQSSGKRQRKVYTITEFGKAELHHWLSTHSEISPQRDELLLKLFFGHHAQQNLNTQHLLQERERLQQLLRRLHAIKQQAQKEQNNQSELTYWLITLNASEAQFEARLKWCEESLALLQ
ncbi:MAG: PadR family transcriptional regulator [Legionellales bacterium]|nr:PadR family transcriptional regulator [Legionellales bacterium]